MAKLRQIEKQETVADRAPGYIVTAASDRHSQSALCRDAHCMRYVFGIRATHDTRGAPIDGAIPDTARKVITFIARDKARPSQTGAKCVEHRGIHDCGLVTYRPPLS
jgi:hypothetical protein